MSEKDVYELFDKMFEQLKSDDSDLDNTSASDFSKIVSEKLDGFAKTKGFENFSGMVKDYDVEIIDATKLANITFKDKRDFLQQALVVHKDNPLVAKYLKMVENNVDIEEIFALVKDEYLTSKDVYLKYIIDAYDMYKKKAMKQLNDSFDKN